MSGACHAPLARCQQHAGPIPLLDVEESDHVHRRWNPGSHPADPVDPLADPQPVDRTSAGSPLSRRRFLRDQGLALAMFGIFALAMIGLVFTGWSSYNRDQALQGEPEVGLPQYLVSAEFGEAVFENWESECLQMGAYILLTAVLFSRGSAESRNPDQRDAQDADPRLAARRRNVP